MSLRKHAHRHAANGRPVFPGIPGGKTPGIDDYPNQATTDPEQIDRWWVDDVMGFEHPYNVCISTNGLCALDVDVKDGRNGEQSLLRLELEGIDLPPTYEQYTPTGGRHIVYRASKPVSNSVQKLGPGLDVRGEGGYIVASGSTTDKGKYTDNGLPIADAPPELLVRCGFAKERETLPAEALAGIDEDRAAARFEEWLKTAPRSVRKAGGDMRAFEIACRGRDFGCSAATVLDLMLSPAWDDGCGWSAEKLQAKVANAFKYAKGVLGSAAPEIEFTVPVPQIEAPARVERLPTIPSDADLAASFSARHGDRLLRCEAFGRWLVWDGRCYRPDTTNHVADLVRVHCEHEADKARAAILQAGGREAAADRARLQIASAKGIRAVATLAAADRIHAVEPASLDSDPWVLNTRAGLFDLKRGLLTPHDRAARCTMLTAAGVGESCPTWLRLVDHVAGGDAAYTAFLQRLAGYALTGSVQEHVFAFLYGPGGTGKSTFIETLRDVLGDYAGTAAVSVFTKHGEGQHPTGLAALQGKRLIVAPETEQGSHWNESLIKGVTGGDQITARYVRCDFFQFTPLFKLVFTGNFRPHLRNVEDGVKRRLLLLPFEHKPAVVEKDLRARLRDEADGILGWALQGARLWLEQGLQPPPAVRAATADYFEAEDDIGRWLSECVEVAPGELTEMADLFRAWEQWARTNGGYTGSLKRLSAEMVRRGFAPCKHPRTRRAGFQGVRLRHEFAAAVIGP